MKPSFKFSTILRRSLLGIAIAATFIALYITVENWRGDRAWAAVERDLKARGELPSIRAGAPTTIPDDQNFFKAPLLARLLHNRPDDLERKKLLAETRLMDFGALGEFLSTATEYSSLRNSLRKAGLLTTADSESPAADILESMECLRPLLDEIADAAQSRRLADFDNDILTSPSPWLIDIDSTFALGRALAARAALRLNLGQIEAAHRDTIAVLRLGNELCTASRSVNLLTVLVGVALHQSAAVAITDGCKRQLWSEPQLAVFDRLLGQLQPLASFRAAMRYERLVLISIVDTRSRCYPENFSWPFWFFHGLAQQNKVSYSNLLDRDVLGALTVNPDRVSLRQPLSVLGKKSRTRQAERFGFVLHPYRWLSDMALTNLGHLILGLGDSTDRLILLRIACAMERHRLSAGTLPNSLDQLIPKFLPAVPTGIFDGQPVQLHKISEDGYEVYFVSRNGRDDQDKGDDAVLKITGR